MAKKKQAERRFGQLPLPAGHKSYRVTKLNWIGLNKRQTINSGELSSEQNMSTHEYPYMAPCEVSVDVTECCFDTVSLSAAIGLYAFEDILVAIYHKKDGTGNLYMRHIKVDESGKAEHSYEGLVGTYESDEFLNVDRSVVLFNQYDNNVNILDAKYTRKLIILPDKKAVNFDFETYNEKSADIGKVYCDGASFRQWNGKEFEKKEIFTCFDLATCDPISYYNDGYVQISTDEYAEIGTDYYERINAEKPYEYKVVSGLTRTTADENGATVNGSSVKGYYTYDEDLTPGGKASEYSADLKLDTFYFNAYESTVYLFVEDESGKKVVDDKVGDFKISSICPFPDINHAVVHQSRLFGVGDDRIYVSGFNDYANWNYDTVNESYAGNAWTTTAQANTKAGGKFTGISVFDNHVCCFKKDFMHEIYNNQNPFRLVDIGTIGTIDSRSIQEVNGRLIFVAEDGVKAYSGAIPREIGTNLGIDRFTYAVAGADDRYYYLSCKDGGGEKFFFVYDTVIGAWSERECGFLANGFAKADTGMYMLTDDGVLLRLDSGDYTNQNWSFETDLSTGTTSSSSYRTVDIKHIRKIQFLAEVPTDGDSFKVYMLCDNEKLDDSNEWQLVYESEDKTGLFPVRVKPRKTAHYGYRLRFEGIGYVKIHEIEVYIRQGGELYESG